MGINDPYKEISVLSNETWTFDFTKVLAKRGTTVTGLVLTVDGGLTKSGEAIGANPLGVAAMVVNYKLTVDAPADDFGHVYEVRCDMTDSAGNVTSRWMYFTLVETL